MYEKLYNFLKNSIIVLSLLIGVKSFSADITPSDIYSDDVNLDRTYTGDVACPPNPNVDSDSGFVPVSVLPSGIPLYDELIADGWTRTYDLLQRRTQVDYDYNGICAFNGTNTETFVRIIVEYKWSMTKVCDACPDQTMTTDDMCGCSCPIGTVFFESTQTCVPECTGDNMDYTLNGGCACNDGFTFDPNNSCVWGDATGDEDNDGTPNYEDPDYDNDGDGTSNSVDDDWLEENPDYDETEGEDTYAGFCDALPVLVADSPAGNWYKSGQLSICGVVEQNEAREGETTYVSRVDAYTCAEQNICVVKLSGCVLGEYYSEALGSCSLPREDVVCSETLDYLIANNNGICQKNFLCEDGVTVYASESIDCPADGTAEANATTNISDQQVMVDALKQYGSATESGQKDIVDNIKVTNDSLETINDTLSGVDTLMKHQNDKLDVANNSLETLNTLITDGVENNYEQLGNIQGAINSADISNQNGLNDISDKLQQLIDKNETSSTDLGEYFEGENPFDGNYTDGSENFGVYTTELNSSFSNFVITDPLGLNAMGSGYAVPEIGFDLQGTSHNMFGSAFMSYVPVELIRSMFMFMAVMAGLFIFFRTV